MIKLIGKGSYKLIETLGTTKILELSRNGLYSWSFSKGIGNLLLPIVKLPRVSYTLSAGKYRLYEVREERNFAGALHLELSIGKNDWQGYLLFNGLPKSQDNENKIIPTSEKIAKLLSTF